MKNPFTFYCYCYKVHFSPSEISSGMASHQYSEYLIILIPQKEFFWCISSERSLALSQTWLQHILYLKYMKSIQHSCCSSNNVRDRRHEHACRQLTRIRLSEHTSMHTSIQSISNSSAKHHNQKPTYIRHPQIKIYAYFSRSVGTGINSCPSNISI